MVDHIDNDHLNNRFENLQLLTFAENTKKYYREVFERRVPANSLARRPIKAIADDGTVLEFVSLKNATTYFKTKINFMLMYLPDPKKGGRQERKKIRNYHLEWL